MQITNTSNNQSVFINVDNDSGTSISRCRACFKSFGRIISLVKPNQQTCLFSSISCFAGGLIGPMIYTFTLLASDDPNPKADKAIMCSLAASGFFLLGATTTVIVNLCNRRIAEAESNSRYTPNYAGVAQEEESQALIPLNTEARATLVPKYEELEVFSGDRNEITGKCPFSQQDISEIENLVVYSFTRNSDNGLAITHNCGYDYDALATNYIKYDDNLFPDNRDEIDWSKVFRVVNPDITKINR